MKTSIKKAINYVTLVALTASSEMMAQGVQINSPSTTLNNSTTNNTRDSILVYIMGWVKWLVIVGIVVSIGMTVFYFATGNKDKGKAWAIGGVTAILIWFLAPSILGAFGITINW